MAKYHFSLKEQKTKKKECFFSFHFIKVKKTWLKLLAPTIPEQGQEVGKWSLLR